MSEAKAINASRMALRGDGKRKEPFDKVIKTMRDTWRDMQDKHKETSRSRLTVNVIEC
jgi:L-serine dehydratase